MNVRLAKPFGVRVGELVDRLEALSYRHGRPQFAISYCIVPAESVFENEVTECARPRAQTVEKVHDPEIVACLRTFGRFCARGRAHSAEALPAQGLNSQTGSYAARRGRGFASWCSRKCSKAAGSSGLEKR